MIAFFYVEQDMDIVVQKQSTPYRYQYQAVNSENNKAEAGRIYFSTYSDFNNHVNFIRQSKGQDVKILVADPDSISSYPKFPQHMGFGSMEELVQVFGQRDNISLGIVNAMSNAIGDHLVGMRALEIFLETFSQRLPNTKLDLTLYQIDPCRLQDITNRCPFKFSVERLPSTVQNLLQHDAFVDLGTMILREEFDKEPMIDFFLKALCVDPQTVSAERKRIKFKVDPTAVMQVQHIFDNIRMFRHPVMLFHHSSTSTIRQMKDSTARALISQLLERSGYFIISAVPLDFEHRRFMDLSGFSQTLDEFAALISLSDAVITVDTSTYHLADAFSIPTVALFTTIEPEYRAKYYPFIEPIMLGEKGGRLYGRHKTSPDKDKAAQEIQHVDQMWSRLTVDNLFDALNRARIRKEASLIA